MASPCIVTYKGVDYSYDEFEALLHDGLLGKMISEGTINASILKGALPKQLETFVPTKVEKPKPVSMDATPSGKDLSADIESLSLLEFSKKHEGEFDDYAQMAAYYNNVKDQLFQREVDSVKADIAAELNSLAGTLSANPIGSTKLWGKMAKLMGLYFKKGVTTVGDFAKAAGYKVTNALSDLWNAITRKGKTKASDVISGAKMRTLNSRLYYAAAVQGMTPGLTAQDAVNYIKEQISVLDTLMIHSTVEDAVDVKAASNALKALYQELSGDLTKVETRIAEVQASAKPVFELGEKLTKVESILLSLQDDMIWQKKAQAEIEKLRGTLPDNMNPYLQRDIAIGKVQQKIDKLYQKIFGKQYGKLGTNVKGEKSLLERMKEARLSQGDLDLFMYAMHAKERNARVKAMSQMRGDETVIEDGSGMTDREADSILAEFERAGKTSDLEKFSKEFRDTVIKPTIEAYRDSGLITPEAADLLLSGESPTTGVKWNYYVPLKVNEGVIADSLGELAAKSSGTAKLKSLKGTSKYDYLKRDSPFARALMDAKAAIKAVADNDVKRSLYELVKDNPNSQTWEIVTAKYITEGDSAKEITPSDVISSSVPVMVDGKKVYIKLNNKGLRDAWLRSPSQQSDFVRAVINVVRTFNNIKRAVLTTWNPIFASKNLLRDVQDAVFNATGLDNPAIGKIVKNIPKNIKSLMKAGFGNLDPNSEMGMLLDEYLEAGGKISWTDYDKIENQLREIDQMSRKYNEGSITKMPIKAFKAAIATVEAFNESVEVATRLAVYKAMRDSGLTKEKAAGISKNLTVNFNRKGTATPVINALYLFSNAGIQSTAAGFTAVAKSKKAKALSAGLVLSGIALPFIQEAMMDMMDDDDEEKEKFRLLISSEEAEGQYILPLGDGRVFRFPKPYGAPRMFFNMGEIIGNAIKGESYDGLSGELFSTIGGAFDPIAAGTPNKLSGVTPTIFKPIVELGMNKDWHNAPIYPTDLFGPPKPDFMTKYDSVNPYFDKFTESMYKATNGSIDVSPETIDYLFSSFSGGIIKELKNGGTELANKIQGETVDMNKIPLYGSFVNDMTTQKWRYTKGFYDIYNRSGKDILSEQEMKDLYSYAKGMSVPESKINKKIKQIRKAQKKLKEGLQPIEDND